MSDNKSIQTEEKRSPEDILKADDDKMIPNAGDKRLMKQKGRIKLHPMPMGSSVAVEPEEQEVDLVFERIRNDKGGVDVICHAPKLDLRGGTN